MPTTLGVIPARLASTRLPRKILRPLAGRPMLAWVYEAARACPQLDELIIACDSEEVLALCRTQGWPAVMTDPALPSGSDRVHAVALTHPAELYVNLQADEPLLRPEHLSTLLTPFASPEVQATTLKVICPPEHRHNPNVVKVVTALDHRALYFSRATIPHAREAAEPDPGPHAQPVWKHIGLYAYRAATLRRFHALPPSPLELTERLEQLRLLENGIPLHAFATPYDTIGVDTEADLERAQQALLQR